MPPAPSLSLEATLASQDWAVLSRRLTKYAYVRLRKSSWSTAEEIAQDAITQALDPAYASWDRERHPELLDFLGHLVNGLVANHFRRNARRGKHVSLREDEGTHDDEAPDASQLSAPTRARAPARRDDPRAEANAIAEAKALAPAPGAVLLTESQTPEDLLTQGSRDATRDELAMAALRARVEGDAVCLALLERMKLGSTRASADAEAIGVTVSEVYTAKKRLLRHTQAIARDFAAAGGLSS